MAWTDEYRRKYHRSYAERHRNDPEWKASMRNRQRRRRHKVKQALIDLMGGKCVRCGFDEHMYGLEFDHKNPTEKQHTVSNLISSGSWEKVSTYVKAQCQLLCANCHALKTVAYGDQSRGNGVCDTSADMTLFEKP